MAGEAAEASAASANQYNIKAELKNAANTSFSTGTEDVLDVFGTPLTQNSVSDPSASVANLAAQVTGAQYNWGDAVTTAWSTGKIDHASVTPYVQKYGADSQFIDPSTGTIKPVTSMTTKQLAAYNAWVQDPAVVKAAWDKFDALQLGQLSHQYDGS
jgi:hypothetical protein